MDYTYEFIYQQAVVETKDSLVLQYETPEILKSL